MTRNDALEALKRTVRGEAEGRYDTDYTYDLGWNAALREVAKLKAQPSPDVECVQKMHELESPDVEEIKWMANKFFAKDTRLNANEYDVAIRVCYDFIDHLISRNLIAQAVPPIEGLDTGLKDAIAVKSKFESEWIILCGSKDSANAILKAASAYAALQRGKE